MKREPATSTNILSFQPDGSRALMTTVIPQLAECGWTHLDLNFCEMMNPNSQLRTPSWNGYIAQLKELQQQLDLLYIQSHAPYERDRFALEEDQARLSDELLMRSIQASAILQVPQVVVHPAPFPGTDACIERNIRWLRPFVQRATELGTSVVVENLDAPTEITRAEDLLVLADELGVGICFDTGHAHLHGGDPQQDIRILGNRIVGTHIADNHANGDEHLLPFYGTIGWEGVMQALHDVGYGGYTTYEVMFWTRNVPTALRPSMLAHARDVHQYLIALGGE